MSGDQKSYVVITGFFYSETGHSRHWLLQFQVTCTLAELPKHYGKWIKALAREEGPGERHFTSRRIIGAYEVENVPVTFLLHTAARQAIDDLKAEEEADERASEVAATVETEDRDRAEYERLKTKFEKA